MPACWPSSQPGRPEYIFNVALTSTGLIVHDNALPDRVADQKLLPLNGMMFGKKIGDDEFADRTDPLYQWSVKHGCRFFVHVFEQTKPDEKDIYKARLRAVGEHFYYYEMTNPGAWSGSAGGSTGAP